MSVLSLRLVPWRNQVYLEFAFEISLVTNLSNSSMHLVYIFFRFATLFEYFNSCSSWVKVVYVV
jgi:hypothetical protein